MRTAFLIGVIALITSALSSNCPSFFDGEQCSDVSCVNGGFKKDGVNACTCPSRYFGIQCEAVKTSTPPDSQSSTGSSFNILNINLFSQYWGQRTYSNIQKALQAHYAMYSNGYDAYNLLHTSSTPYLGPTNDPVEDFKFDSTKTEKFPLPDWNDAGLYWCYTVPFYDQIVNLIRNANLRSTVITIITEHPPEPSDSDLRAAREAALSFDVKINVLWINDPTYSRCKVEDVAAFKDFVGSTGGLFVQLQSEFNDDVVQKLITRVFMTHYRPQYVAIQSFPDCSKAQSVSLPIDPEVGQPYSFVLLGENTVPTEESFINCSLGSALYSFDKQLAIFQTPHLTCSTLQIKATGSCSAIVFTNAVNNQDTLDLTIHTTYVKNRSVDSSRYAIVENVPFYPAFHVETPTGSDNVLINSVSAPYDTTWKADVVKRNPAAYEWTTSKQITCDASQTNSLSLSISVVSVNTTVQRAVRVACIPPLILSTTVPDITTLGPTTPPQPTTNVVATTNATSTTQDPTKCAIGTPSASFLFAYAADVNGGTFYQVLSTIVNEINANSFNYGSLDNVRIDTKAGEQLKYNTDSMSFSLSCQKTSPNATIAADPIHPSDGLEAITSFLSYHIDNNNLESSMQVIMVNRLPVSSADLTDNQYDSLANKNVKIFPIISVNSLVEHTTFEGRSGAVYNRIAAQTNGHYIVVDDEIHDGSSDYSQVVSTLMKTAYAQNLLFTRNIGVNRVGNSIGTVRIPSSNTKYVTVTITVTLSVVDTNVPQAPNRLILAFKAIGANTETVSLDFLNPTNVTNYNNSNFYTTTINLQAGYDHEIFLVYIPGQDRNDLLIRLWIPGKVYHHAAYVGLDDIYGTNELSQVDEYSGAALRMQFLRGCYGDQPGTLLITDCNGEVSAKYDASQTVAIGSIFKNDNQYTHYPFVPFFCDSKPREATCVSGSESKFDAQFVTSDYSISLSFQCRPGVGSIDPSCKRKDSNGNYQCSLPAPFKRGPTGKLTDCSNHGHLEFRQTESSDDAVYKCICEVGYDGESCEKATCSAQNTDFLATNNDYHTYTVVLGLETDWPYTLTDAKEYFGLGSLTTLDKIWKYQLFIYCADGRVDMLYSGSSLKLFQAAFDSHPICNAQAVKGAIDLTKVYTTAVQGIGRNVKGVIAYFSQVSNMLSVSLDEFIPASQTYQQQVFVFGVDEDSGSKVVRLNETIAQAAMSTGGFLIQSSTSDDILDEKFIPSLLQSSSSIALFSPTQDKDFSFFTENTETVAYLLTWGVGEDLKNKNDGLLNQCFQSYNTSLSCPLTGKTSYQIAAKTTQPFYMAVYILGDVAPRAQIISDLDQDVSNSVSTTTSNTKAILSIYVDEKYTIVPNDDDQGVNRLAQRNGCTFGWTAYSVFNENFPAGANFVKITLQKKTDGIDQYTRFFAFGTSAAPVCQNGGTAETSTGSCACPADFQGPDCSLVKCPENSKSNAWGDVCVCNDIDDVVCARNLTSSDFFH
uniref:EGF-like domain-containing protein n=1 Tax=Caenorhabditis japonica TaxID=281687 RepID=A0A8R1HGY3_CAEJA